MGIRQLFLPALLSYALCRPIYAHPTSADALRGLEARQDDEDSSMAMVNTNSGNFNWVEASWTIPDLELCEDNSKLSIWVGLQSADDECELFQAGASLDTSGWHLFTRVAPYQDPDYRQTAVQAGDLINVKVIMLPQGDAGPATAGHIAFTVNNGDPIDVRGTFPNNGTISFPNQAEWAVESTGNGPPPNWGKIGLVNVNAVGLDSLSSGLVPDGPRTPDGSFVFSPMVVNGVNYTIPSISNLGSIDFTYLSQ